MPYATRIGWIPALGRVAVAATLAAVAGASPVHARADTAPRGGQAPADTVPPPGDAADPTAPAADPAAATADVAGFTLSQVLTRPPVLRVYLRAPDATGRSVPNLDAGALSATVAGEAVPVLDVRHFEETDEGVAYLFVVDVSRSVTPRQFTDLRNALRGWAASLRPQDRAAVLAFGTSVEVLVDFTADTTAVADALGELALTDNLTRFYDAMMNGLAHAARQDATLPDRRVMVVLSDGQETAVGAFSEREVLDRIAAAHVPIFAVGFYLPPRTEAKEQGLLTLGSFARASGGMFLRADTVPAGAAAEALTEYARNVLIAELGCEGCPRDGRIHRLQLALTAGPRTLEDGAYVRLLAGAPLADEPVEAEAAPTRAWWQGPVPLSALLAALATVAVLPLLARRRRRLAAGAVGAAEDDEPGDDGPGSATPAPDAAAAGTAGSAPPVRAASAPPLRISLTPLGRQSAGTARTFVLTDEVRIGRSERAADVVVPDDPEISAAHCLLLRRDGVLVVRDLGSTNGTWVNGVPIRGEQRVENGDVIRIGRSELRLNIREAGDAHRT